MSRYIKFDDAVKVMACEMYAEAQSQGYDVDGIEDFMPEAKAWLNDAPSIDIEPNSSEIPNNSTISKMEQVDKDINVRSKDEPQTSGTPYKIETSSVCKDEPQTCSVNGRPYSECSSCEHFRCTADEPQTEDAYAYDADDWYDKAERSE